ncbi:MAG: MotA/TolQ/ExbB proton channel family protein [Gammaproteobacteria bacterium]|nr:MotA/TolQ/ExbB proton channel family protein [Gammaproteobacteria bacterium]
MYELVRSGGWLMWPILLCSVVAVGIIVERFWTLSKGTVAPKGLAGQVQRLVEAQQLNNQNTLAIKKSSPLGRILAAALENMHSTHDVMKEAVEEAGRHVVHDLERYLNTLGTIAAITPLLGLLGTVIGMIKVFASITAFGVGDPTVLAGGISEALITTAAGLSVGIPSLMFYRYFRGRVNELTVNMEQEAVSLIEIVRGLRRSESRPTVTPLHRVS